MSVFSRLWLVMMMMGSTAVASSPEATVEDVTARLEFVQRVAMTASPRFAERLQQALVRGAEARGEAAAINPYVEWQSEGLGGDRTPNAQDSLRLGTPFNFLGQIGPARDLARAAEDGTVVLREAASRSAAVEATLTWLELAAAVETREVRQARLERLEAALAVLEARHQLGEVAGTIVSQLELEQTTAVSQLATAERGVAALSAALRALCGTDVPPPVPGDLEALVTRSHTPASERITHEALKAGVPMRAIQTDADLAEARARMAAATAWGRPEIEAEWERFPDLDGLDGYDAWGFRIAVPLPFGSSGARQREAARERQALASAAREAAALDTVREAGESMAAAVGAERALRSLEPVLVGLDAIERSLEAQYRLGALSYLEYVYGIARHDEVLLEAIGSRAELASARLKLGYLLGDDSLFPMAAVTTEDDS